MVKDGSSGIFPVGSLPTTLRIGPCSNGVSHRYGSSKALPSSSFLQCMYSCQYNKTTMHVCWNFTCSIALQKKNTAESINKLSLSLSCFFPRCNHYVVGDDDDYYEKCSLGHTINVPFEAPDNKEDDVQFRYSIVFTKLEFLENRNTIFPPCPGPVSLCLVVYNYCIAMSRCRKNYACSNADQWLFKKSFRGGLHN